MKRAFNAINFREFCTVYLPSKDGSPIEAEERSYLIIVEHALSAVEGRQPH